MSWPVIASQDLITVVATLQSFLAVRMLRIEDVPILFTKQPLLVSGHKFWSTERVSFI